MSIFDLVGVMWLQRRWKRPAGGAAAWRGPAAPPGRRGRGGRAGQGRGRCGKLAGCWRPGCVAAAGWLLRALGAVPGHRLGGPLLRDEGPWGEAVFWRSARAATGGRRAAAGRGLPGRLRLRHRGSARGLALAAQLLGCAAGLWLGPPGRAAAGPSAAWPGASGAACGRCATRWRRSPFGATLALRLLPVGQQHRAEPAGGDGGDAGCCRSWPPRRWATCRRRWSSRCWARGCGWRAPGSSGWRPCCWRPRSRSGCGCCGGTGPGGRSRRRARTRSRRPAAPRRGGRKPRAAKRAERPNGRGGECRASQARGARPEPAGRIQRELPVGVAQLGRADQRGGGDADGMQGPLDLAAPELEEAGELGEVRREVQLLPDEGLQDARMVRHVVQDLGRGQPPVGHADDGVDLLKQPAVPFQYRIVCGGVPATPVGPWNPA